jgi:parallel beta-helix repeat protein
VLVGPGVYYENIVWPSTQGIHLTSEFGPDTSIIDGDSTGRVIGIATGVDSTTIVSGFTIRNGYLPNTNDRGAGVYCESSSPTITNNVITDNSVPGYGGGVACGVNSSPAITNNVITGNTIRGACGGGIVCLGNSSPTITGNTVSENGGGFHDGARGGGIACCDSSSPVITGNNITGNYGHGAGGGIYCESSSLPTITNNVITGNSTGSCMCAWIGGGIACCDSSSPVITDNTIAGNYGNFGGGIGCANSEPLITDNTITGNTGYSGGGIYCYVSSPTIINNTISNDTAWHGGGIVCWSNSSPTIDSCTIANNNPDGVYCDNTSSPEIHYCDIFDNTGYGVCNMDAGVTVDAEYNWWGDASGPYHPTANPGGLGDTVSDYVDFDPWTTGVEEQPIIKPIEIHGNLAATIFSGPLQLPKGKKCKVFDITGRVVEPDKIQPGIYFIEIDGVVTQKVVKVR